MLQPGTCSARSSEVSTWTGPAGRARDHVGAERIVGGRQVGTADAADVGGVQAERQVVGPLGGRVGVRVEVGDQVAPWPPRSPRCERPRGRSARSRRGGPAGGERRSPRSRRWSRRRRRGPRGRGSRARRCGAGTRRSCASALCAQITTLIDGQRKSRSRTVRRFQWEATSSAGPRRAVLAGQAEAPAVDRRAADPPLVGPREDPGAGDAALDRGLELPVEHLRLMLLAALAGAGVEADLAEDEGPVAGEVVKPGQVAPEVLAALEEDVEHEEVEGLERQVLGRRVVGVGDELIGILLAHRRRRARAACRRPGPCRASAGRRRGPRCPATGRGSAGRRRGAAPPGAPRRAPRAPPSCSRGARRRAGSASPGRRRRRGPAARCGGEVDQVVGRERVGADDREPGLADLRPCRSAIRRRSGNCAPSSRGANVP